MGAISVLRGNKWKEERKPGNNPTVSLNEEKMTTGVGINPAEEIMEIEAGRDFS